MYWETGTDRIGDFTDIGGAMIVKGAAADHIKRTFPEVSLSPVECVKRKSLIKSKNWERQEPRVWWPYEGEPLFEIDSKIELCPDADRTTFDPPLDSGLLVNGCAEWDMEFVGKPFLSGPPRWYLRARQPGRGVYIDKRQLPRGANIFKIVDAESRPISCRGGGDWSPVGRFYALYCTDRAKSVVEKKQYTNISFVEVGEFF